MIGKTVLITILFMSLVLESTLLPFPFVLLFSLLYLFYYDDIGALVSVLVLSVLLDAFSMRHVGITGLFIFGALFGSVILEKALSLQGPILFTCVLLLSVFFYSSWEGYQFSVILSAILLAGVILFIVIERRRQKKGGVIA